MGRKSKYEIEKEKRYHRFRHNNLPKSFYDRTRDTVEYVYFDNKYLNDYCVSNTLLDAFNNIIPISLYYSFNCRYQTCREVDGELICEDVVGHLHEHSFDDVIKHLYNSPESFSINEEDKYLYSEQELSILNNIQKYLLLIGVKDIKNGHITNSRYQNKLHEKYYKASTIKEPEEIINKITNNELDYLLVLVKDDYNYFDNEEKKILIRDLEGNYRIYAKITKIALNRYKDLDKKYKLDVSDKQMILILTFKVLKILK